MTQPCRIGRTGRAAAGAATALRARLCAPTAAGRLELPVPPLVARLLALRSQRTPAPVLWARHTELRLAAVTILGSAAAPAASVAVPAPALPVTAASAADAPAAAPQLRLVRETLRERVERTVERVLARGRRDEPRPRAMTHPEAAVARRDAAPASAEPLFPALAPNVPTAASAAAIAIARAGAAEPAAPAPRGPALAEPAQARRQALPDPSQMPQLVDAIVGELDRRTRAQRERSGFLA